MGANLMIQSVKFMDYKSFTKEFAEISPIKKLNIFIGRNNCGKSSCLDVIEFLTDATLLKKHKDLNRNFKISVSCELSDEIIKKAFHPETHSSDIPGYVDNYTFGKNYIGKTMLFDVSSSPTAFNGNIVFTYDYIKDISNFPEAYNSYWNQLGRANGINHFSNAIFRRISAERNIVPESEQENIDMDSYGNGASNIIRKFINHSDYDEKLIEKKLLEELNKIIYPDSEFTNIRTQQIIEDGKLLWEIFLQENDSRFQLSKMGSGLKTVILVLLNLLIVPKIEKYQNHKIIFAFEELENNLHPALQRRLFDYIYDFSQKHDLPIFLTTHSHVAINAFSDKEDAQIYHVIKDSNTSTLHKIDDYLAKTSLLDDLDVRASDLLQSNGIIWVEGPSDRVYIKHWLNIFCSDDLIEGRDYQFLYYGGRLLSHYTLASDQQNLINILLTNRNSIIVIDSDKTSKGKALNDTKKRIISEFKKYNCICWVTKGKEIENYIPEDAVEKLYNKKPATSLGQYELFPKYIEELEPNFTNKKVDYAIKICQYITVENSKAIYDLKPMISSIYNKIKSWNKI